MYQRFFTWLQLRLQRSLLSIPKISEARLASSKTMAFLRAWHFVARAKVAGDYLEFGVFQGFSFDMSLRCANKFLNKADEGSPRFFAFDSFEGLPEPDPSRDAVIFKKGEYQAGLDVFRKTIRASSSGWKVLTIKGFFENSLKPSVIADHQIKSAAFIAFDADLYPSTIQALRFCTPVMKTGTVLYFDDWFCSTGDMSLGEAGACADWLKENPEISLVDYGIVGIMGKMFIVNRKH